MADPWKQDFETLGETSREQLRSMAATRAHVLSQPEKTKMSMFRNRPLFAAMLVLGLVGAAGAGAYAVKHVLLTVDTDKSAPEIKADLEHQLEQAGVHGEVRAEKQDGLTNITVTTDDQAIDSESIRVDLPKLGDASDASARQKIQFNVDDSVKLTDAQSAALPGVMGTKAVAAALMTHEPAKVIVAIRAELAAVGFTDVSINATTDSVDVTINSAPKTE